MVRQDRILSYLLLLIVSTSIIAIPDSLDDATDIIDSSTSLTDETTISETDNSSTKITPPLTLIPEPIEITDEINTPVIILTTRTTETTPTTRTTETTPTTRNTTFYALNDAIGVYSSYFVLTLSIVLVFI